MIKSDENTKLIDQTQISGDDRGWGRAVFDDIESRLLDPGFPCVFSKNAFRKQILKFIFVEDAGSAGILHLGEGLKEYVQLSREWDGRLDSACPLVVAFSPDAVDARSVDDYHTFGWKVLQALHEIDPAPWPEEVGKDPASASWSMCFNGMPLFCNMSSPAHRVRQSRNLGDHFVLVINPRERFDVFAGDTPSGRKVRSTESAVTTARRIPGNWALTVTAHSNGASTVLWKKTSRGRINVLLRSGNPESTCSRNRDGVLTDD